jgi:hypothetical protein
MSQGMLSLAGAVVGALVAVIGGVLLTYRKIRKERGYDRRLQWCESMMAALNATGAAVTTAAYAEDPDAREACWTEVLNLHERLIPLCGQKELYAPVPAIQLIQTFMRELSRLIELHLAADAGEVSTPTCRRCLDALGETAGALAQMARGHLGLEPVPRALIDQRDRFVGSFRGRKVGGHRGAFGGAAGV